ncbi:MAG TPA: hypothetical protein VFF73_18700 [Planctomycetota bacterium]|nr:hypothetical protein [Planctomycetota bacterium]
MTRRAFAGSTILVLIAALASTARADIVSDLTAKVGQTIDLSGNPTLRQELVDAGVIKQGASSVTVTSDALTKAMAYQRFRNQVDATRYHVGERILVEETGPSGSKYSPRAEITAVNADGTYTVKVWDKVLGEDHPDVTGSGYVNLWTGKIPAGEETTTVKNPDGTTREVASPWLLKGNERTITLTQAQVDALNGRVEDAGSFTLNGYKVDPNDDWVLKDRIARANAIADKIFKPGSLTLPTDPAARAKKLDQISKLQAKFLDEVFKDNYMEHPGNEDEGKDPGFDQEYPRWAGKASDRLSKTLKDHPELRGKVGALLEAGYGVCTEQAAAIAAVVEGVAGRVGLTLRPFQGRTIGEGAKHGINIIRFANGELGMYDVTWHFIDEADAVHAVDNLDFATFDTRGDSNRNIDVITQPTTKATGFVDRMSQLARDLFRGYSAEQAEVLMALKTAETAIVKKLSFEDAATKVVTSNEGADKVAGDFSAAALASRARAITGPSATPGFLSALGKGESVMSDRVRGAVDPGRAAEER